MAMIGLYISIVKKLTDEMVLRGGHILHVYGRP